jgi:drug/metabolite transporter (DMT)-like permease
VRAKNPIPAGIWVAILAAVTFGATTPFIKRAAGHTGAFFTAAFLYTGAAMASAVFSLRSAEREAPVRRRHLPRLAAVALVGAVFAPACFAWGLARTSATEASLLLNFEAPFTVACAALLYREHVDRKVAGGIACITLGGAVLVLGGGSTGSVSVAGTLAILAATLGWALDNTLTRPLADLNPSTVVLGKALVGATLSLGVAAIATESLPSVPGGLVLLACGAAGYGLSLRLYLLAQRRIGAARTASIFAGAPLVGALASWASGDPAPTAFTLAAAALFLIGARLHIGEDHDHQHTHAALDHEHAHSHDDGHHDHSHAVGHAPGAGEHSHPHRHDETTHTHPHAPDAHHRHVHR